MSTNSSTSLWLPQHFSLDISTPLVRYLNIPHQKNLDEEISELAYFDQTIIYFDRDKQSQTFRVFFHITFKNFQLFLFTHSFILIHSSTLHIRIMPLALFENRQTFESLSDLILRVNEHFDFEDYVVVILRTKKFKLDVIKKTWLICDRDERIRESQDQNRRHTASKLIECSFFMIVKRLNDFDDSSWFLKMINSRHNHFFSLVDAHFVLRKMTMTFEVKNEIFR
jgi:hypothetical protein